MTDYWFTKLSIFGSSTKATFDPKKTLYSNFVSMCSLPWYKNNSPETLNLINVIKQHNTILQQTNIRDDHKIDSINKVLNAIATWKTERSSSHDKSWRCSQIQNFYSNLENERNALLKKKKYRFTQAEEGDMFELNMDQIRSLDYQPRR